MRLFSVVSASRSASSAASRPRLQASPAQPRAAADAQAAASQTSSPAGRAKSTAAVRASPTPAKAPIQRRTPEVERHIVPPLIKEWNEAAFYFTSASVGQHQAAVEDRAGRHDHAVAA